MNDMDFTNSADPPKKPGNATRRIVILLATPLVLAAVLLVWAHRPSFRVVGHWPQSTNVQYGAGDPYHFLVVEGDRDWSGLPFRMGRNYFLLVGREISGDQYGYRVNYSFHPSTLDVEAHIRRCTVEWTPAGVSFYEPSGQRLFIPKELFATGS